MKKYVVFIAVSLCIVIAGCIGSFNTALKKAGINDLIGQTVYNRVNFRPVKENKIRYTNYYHKGALIPAGSICIIKEISKSAIVFLYVSGKSKSITLELSDWLIGPNKADIRQSFYKFFTENKDSVGLDAIRSEYLYGVTSGNEQLGMTKEEILICLGYPAYIGDKKAADEYGRDAILKQDKWYYLKGRFNKYLLIFKDGKLYRTED